MPNSGHITESETRPNHDLYVYEWDCVADGGAGAELSFTTVKEVMGFLYMVKVIPDATTHPAGSFAITLKDGDGIDVMGGVLASLSLTLAAHYVPAIGGAYGPRRVADNLKVDVTGNTQAGAKFVLKLYISPPANLWQ